ncbi:MAG TPA: 50S ribosomal protein L9 [Candidatus Brocadiia bacterium]|nr:50S ribosomal protein L9 [Planctomycetota bacterium]MBI4007437.1 50S ribosomal protein L9 [Planctomycetota bacterium]MDO8092135.1 50S ribosomal protein L9 [Candidatus Brocadiales bacterium]
MDVLLKKDVIKLGRMGEVVNVAEGYARNYLLPRGFATTVNPTNLKQIDIAKKKYETKVKEEKEKLQAVAEKLSECSITINAKANEEGRLFGSVTAEQIVEMLKKEGYPIEKEMILLESPIKQCDVYNVPISLHPEIQTQCKVWVIRESEEAGTEIKSS